MAKDVEMTEKKDAQDVEMKDAKDAKEELTPEARLTEALRADLKLIARAVSDHEHRLFGRLNARLLERKTLDTGVLGRFLKPAATPVAAAAREHLPSEEAEEVSGVEQEAYLALLALVLLIDRDLPAALQLASSMLPHFANDRAPTMRFVINKFYFYFARVYELSGRAADVRPALLARFRTACLHKDEAGQAVLLNLLLRNYLHYNLVDQAIKLVSKTSFPDTRVNSQYARYLYYLGRVKAVQLEYSEAHAYVVQALRKGPKPGSRVGRGFRATATKLSVVVELLMGEIPERSTFANPEIASVMLPYFEITRAVRNGDLKTFRAVVAEHEATFQADRNLSLIQRLRHNVVKTGLRAINVAYSCIHLKDVAEKLSIDPAGVEGIVAKAIADGVIDAKIHHSEQYLQSQSLGDIYATVEPQKALHKRITFLLQLHSETVKAMQYPDEVKAALPDEDARERERAALAAADEMDEDDFFL